MTDKPEGVLTNPCLYILMRTDINSMNPGKAMAQASHAYGALRKAIKEKLNIQKDFILWMDQTEQDFGTTIVLGGSEPQIDGALWRAVRDRNICGGWVHDPTYPIRDGNVTHLIPLNTCAFLFGARADIQFHTVRMDLYT